MPVYLGAAFVEIEIISAGSETHIHSEEFTASTIAGFFLCTRFFCSIFLEDFALNAHLKK